MSLHRQVGSELAPFLRWLVDRGDWDLRTLLDVLDDPAAWEPEFVEWQSATEHRPTDGELEGEERATRS